MRGKSFFECNNVVPTAEFVSSIVQNACLLKAYVCVKLHAVVGAVFIVCFRTSDDSIQIDDVHRAERFF